MISASQRATCFATSWSAGPLITAQTAAGKRSGSLETTSDLLPFERRRQALLRSALDESARYRHRMVHFYAGLLRVHRRSADAEVTLRENCRAYTDGVDVPDQFLASILRVVTSEPDVSAVYVFGSRADGGARPASDFDLGVLYRSPQSLERTLQLEQELERATGLTVDLVDVARAGAFLAYDIIRGERVFCRETTATDRFELYVLRRAGDLLPFERQRQALLLSAAR